MSLMGRSRDAFLPLSRQAADIPSFLIRVIRAIRGLFF
jgi:hypothetical protein